MFSIRNQLHNEPITVRLMVATNEPLIQFSNDQSSLNTTDIYLAISSGGCTIDWGDGNTTAATGSSSTKYSNDYTAAGTGTYNIVIYVRSKYVNKVNPERLEISPLIEAFQSSSHVNEVNPERLEISPLTEVL